MEIPVKRLTLGQRMGLSSPQAAEIASGRGTSSPSPSIGQQWLVDMIQKAGDDLSRMTPLERMNRRYPNMKLRQLPEKMRDLFGDPDLDVCLQYYRRFMAASESEGDEPVAILCEFLREHSIEFQCSGWVWYAFGYIVLGYPDLRNCERRARKLFSLLARH